jgi:nitroimidazol reductase NimA-like FMN-containing flavoprotein (pyridoxamine 5'-phosphate oxidase superfamily)
LLIVRDPPETHLSDARPIARRARKPTRSPEVPMPSRTTRQPRFTVLTPEECRALIGRNHVGRIAFFNHGVVDIEPVHYAAADSWIFVRSAEGTKLEVFAHHPYVAFEDDEIDATFDWRSVVAHGTVYLMSEDGIGVDRVVFERAVRALRSFIPATLATNDPTPARRRIYGVHVDRMTGRRAEQRVLRRSHGS